MNRSILSIGILLTSLAVNAKTPSEVYEQAAKSTVVVRNMDGNGKAQSMGSGVILPDRDVVTNCHVIKGASQLKVRIDKKEYPATLRHSDWERDVCSLSVVGVTAPAIVMGSTKKLKVGARVYAIGAPKGLELTLSEGIVSSLREATSGQYIQTTAAISPGSSGGGLYDENGTLVGLTTFYLAEGQSLNFALPVEWIQDLPNRNQQAYSTDRPEPWWSAKLMEIESRKDYQGLLAHCMRWTESQPSNGWAWFGLGVAYLELGMYANAVSANERALKINPDLAPIWNNLGLAYKRLNDHARAIDAFRQAIRIDREHVAAWNNLGSIYGMTKQSDKALEAFTQAVRIDPDNAEGWFLLGTAYTVSKHDTKAIEAFRQSLRVNPENDEAWISLAYAYGATHQDEKATAAAQQAVQVAPRNGEAWYTLGGIFAATGQREKVIDIYKRLKSVDPSWAEKFFRNFVMP